ncbi:sigma-70 family RNA polymerase sigma factor [Bordetella holmesii]|nr:RNA polymerase sigma factor, sigma-70 family protein [Bordetella holmesii ATCC 51541]AWP68364.1 RNA polymerase subunit sigma [Bordetella holmesii]EWM50501.1 RNA polymerase sigma factor, sigma-70 family protein [Bordetella holmesii 70147]AWP94452.1 RNA polymerase subunit sigma [Bordetella holmesii]QGB09358.1 sigma-70 family RNA polymerase sigma factor [Bordetella holmesii]
MTGLYVEHSTWLQGWLRKRVGDTFAAEDLAQDTFLSLLDGKIVPGEIRQPRPFLATIAGRLLAHRHRRQLLETAYLEALACLPEEVAPSPERRLLALESLQQIDRVLDGLPAKVREAFLLAHLFEMTYAEIAERLGASSSSVKQYLTRANQECLFALAL